MMSPEFRKFRRVTPEDTKSMIMLERLAQSFVACLRSGDSADSALDDYLEATNSRAVGLWRLVDDELHVIGFRGHATMPVDVVDGFAAATQVVNLQQTGLGIVKAAVSQQPTVALLAISGGTLPGSASWLERFAAVQSLAVPIIRGGRVRGVLALSTAYSFGPDHAAWLMTVRLAERLTTLI
ncbi:MAG: GAF domain-containing protein [Planctomycetota bacterium]